MNRKPHIFMRNGAHLLADGHWRHPGTEARIYYPLKEAATIRELQLRGRRYQRRAAILLARAVAYYKESEECSPSTPADHGAVTP